MRGDEKCLAVKIKAISVACRFIISIFSIPTFCKRKSLWLLYMVLVRRTKSSVKYQFTKKKLQTECESLKSIPDCSGVKSTIYCINSNEWKPFMKMIRYFSCKHISTFSMKNYAFAWNDTQTEWSDLNHIYSRKKEKKRMGGRTKCLFWLRCEM